MSLSRNEWLQSATTQLKEAGIDSARLDSELLLTHALNISRTTLHAHPELDIPQPMHPVLEAMLSLRVIRVPLAYTVGHREFYGRLFKVTPSVLIPRPETEDIVTILKELPTPGTIIDVGTGSGALAVTLAIEFPAARVVGSDVSSRALTVAKQNADTYQTDISFVKSDLLADIPFAGLKSNADPTVIVANLPYVALSDDRSPETKFEPEEALFAADNGLELMYRLIEESLIYLDPGDYLLLESNPSQQQKLALRAEENGFTLEQTRNLITVLRRA